MDAFLKTIGTLIVGAIIITVPILLSMSFVFDWYDSIKFLLIVCTVIDYIFICIMICDLAVKGEVVR